MSFLKNRRAQAGAVILLLAIPGAWLLARDKGSEASPLIAGVTKGEFKVTVTTSGELRAPQVRPDHGPAERAAGRGLPDEDRVAGAGGDAGEGGRRGRRARPLDHRHQARRSHARAAEGAGGVRAGRCSTRRSTSPRRAKRSAPWSWASRRRGSPRSRRSTKRRRSSVRPRSTREGRARAGPGEGRLQDEDRAGPGEDARGRRRPATGSRTCSRSCRT